ncbi:MAG: hypothetical protein LC646_08905, partial [Xanthomonadaceae bacterium]|nr:hypothetical protein [Xanthomonadaceae bacterium]
MAYLPNSLRPGNDNTNIPKPDRSTPRVMGALGQGSQSRMLLKWFLATWRFARAARTVPSQIDSNWARGTVIEPMAGSARSMVP